MMNWGTATRAMDSASYATATYANFAPLGKTLVKKENTARQKFLNKLRKKFKPSDKCLFVLEKKAYAGVLCLP